MNAALQSRLGLAIVCLGAAIGPLDTTVNTAFPVITAAFGLAPHEIQWVVIAFVLAQSSLTLVFGRLGDLFGYRRIFAIGLVACALAHAAVALAPDYPTLVAMRAFQGLGVGLVVSCGPALATLMFAPHQKRQVIAIFVTATSVAMALGPWLGGLLLSAFGWPGVYWFRVPLALLALALVPVLPLMAGAPPAGPGGPGAGISPAAGVTADLTAGTEAAGGRFDWAGAIGLTAVMCCLILGLTELARPLGHAAWGLSGVLAGIVGAALFVRHEQRTEHPVLRMTPFGSPRFAGVQLASVFVNFACFANLLLLPYVLTRGMGVSIATAGMVLSLYPTGSVLGGMLASRLGAHMASARLMALGLGLAACGLLLTAAILAQSLHIVLGLGMLVCGLGQGLFQVGYMDTTTSLLPAHERGVAGSLVNVTRGLGIVFGAAGISWLNGLWRSEAISFALVGSALALVALTFATAVRRSRLTAPL